MKLAIIKEHRDFFQKQGYIEFENFLTATQLQEWNQAIDQALASRLKISLDQLGRGSAEELFLQGRDLWRISERLKKLVCQMRYAKIASELVEQVPLRLGYDQLFPAIYQGVSLRDLPYKRFLQRTATLEEVSSLKGVSCGLMLALGPAAEVAPLETEEGINVFPRLPGYAVFFRPQVPIQWGNFYRYLGQRFFLIVYAQVNTYYERQPNDPHLYALKQLGYNFNDKLLDRSNPILYR